MEKGSPLMRTVRPRTAGSAPKRRVHMRWVSTATLPWPGWSSFGAKNRPWAGDLCSMVGGGHRLAGGPGNLPQGEGRSGRGDKQERKALQGVGGSHRVRSCDPGSSRVTGRGKEKKNLSATKGFLIR